jgi:hypothetical protein
VAGSVIKSDMIVWNHSSHTVHLERGGQTQSVAPGMYDDASLLMLADGELFLRADGQVEAKTLRSGREVLQITFKDPSQVVYESRPDDDMIEDDDWPPDLYEE